MAIQNVKAGIQRLEGMKISVARPPDYLVEMVKTDGHMKRVKQKLLEQQNNMNKFEERKRRKQDQKFAKKVPYANNLDR
jgi:rRNA-processing protein EBP2